jgi:hypothetical protein
MTRIEKLAKEIEKLYEENQSVIDALPIRGPSGGTNARYIEGWKNYQNGTITRAANMTNMPVLQFWSGHNPTPSSALPKCLYDQIMQAYKEIFDK